MFPAFLGVIFIMSSTQAVGMELREMRNPAGPRADRRAPKPDRAPAPHRIASTAPGP